MNDELDPNSRLGFLRTRKTIFFIIKVLTLSSNDFSSILLSN